jgi:hypothetical protein
MRGGVIGTQSCRVPVRVQRAGEIGKAFEGHAEIEEAFVEFRVQVDTASNERAASAKSFGPELDLPEFVRNGVVLGFRRAASPNSRIASW